MAINRILIPKTTWAKLNSQLGKAGHEETKRALQGTRTSRPTGGGAVLWAPTPELCDELRAILTREETFVRRKGTCSHLDLLSTITKLREFAHTART